MKNHSKNNVLPLSVYTDKRIGSSGPDFDEIHISNHGNGKLCTKCSKRKETKKVGKDFLCKECRKEIND